MARTFSFVQITDIHIGAKAEGRDLAEDLCQIEREVGARVEFIAATGDLTNKGTDAECRDYVEATKATRLKVHPVVGNHDYINGVDWGKGPRDAGSYIKQISPLNYSFDFNGVHFISYDSIATDNEKRPSEWLLADLAAQPREMPVILLVHYQLDAAFYEPLKPYRIVATLSGHWHTSRLFHDGRIAHYNSPSLCFGGIDYSPRAYRVFHWDGSNLRCETVPLRRPEPKREKKPGAAEVLWSAPLDAETLIASPLVDSGRVYAGLMNENEMKRGALACWDAQTGRQLWRVALDASVKNTPALYKDSVIATTVTGEVFSAGGADGKRRWTYQLGDPSRRWIFSSPCVQKDRVYTGQGPHFAALDAATGKELWVRTDLTGSDWISSFVSPAANDKHVYAGFFWQGNGLYCLDARTGATVWKVEKASDFSSTPVLDGRGALFTLRGQDLHKIDTATGATLWKHPVGEVWNPSTPLLADGMVIAASGAGKVFAVDAESGAQRWTWECGEDLASMLAYRRSSKTILSSPRLAGGTVIVGCNDGRLVGLNVKSGRMAWEHDFGASVTSSPAIAGERMIIPVRDGRLYALKLPVAGGQ